MALTLRKVEDALRGQSLVRAIDRLSNGAIRIETGMVYPDGTSIEVFVPVPGALFDPPRLSDFGQTLAWLLNVQVKPWLSKKRSAFLEDALKPYGARKEDGELVYDLPDEAELAHGVIRLGQACLRTADLIFTRRASVQAAFTEEIEETIADTEIPYDKDVELAGRFGKIVRVDFLVRGPEIQTGILTITASNQSQAHTVATEAFRKWYDLDVRAPQRVPLQRLTVYDDRQNVYKDDDLRRLEDYSTVLGGSDREALVRLVAA